MMSCFWELGFEAITFFTFFDTVLTKEILACLSYLAKVVRFTVFVLIPTSSVLLKLHQG